MNRKRITTILIFMMLIVFSTEVPMATKGNNQLAGRPDNYKASNIPLAPANQKGNQALAPKGKNAYDEMQQREDTKIYDQLQQQADIPPWLDTLINMAGGATTGGAVQNPVLAGAALGSPQVDAGYTGLQLAARLKKQRDDLQLQAGKSNDSLVNRMLAARTDKMRGFQGRSDVLAPHSGAGAPSGGTGGFGTTYGGNWGGGGDGGGGYGGGYSDYPSWMQYLLGLYSWNIK